MAEARTITKDDKKAGAAGGAGGADAAAGGGKKKKKKLLAILAGVLLLGGGAAWFFLLGPGAGKASAEAEPPPELGAVLTVDPISINLADGHYLKLGLGLQTIAAVAHEPDGSVALDAAISLYSGRTMTELSDPVQRDALKAEFKHSLEEKYHHDVVDVYFTEYVMQ